MSSWMPVNNRSARSGIFSIILCAGLAIPGVLADMPCAGAQELPNETMKVIVPFGPGGSADSIARVIADQLSKQLGRPVVVLNRPGASSIIGTQAIAQAEPTGSVIGFATTTTLSIVPAVYAQLPFDSAADLRPLALLAVSPSLLIASKSASVNSLDELVAAVKKQKDGFYYGSAGVGHTYHMLMELFKRETGTEMTHVPYRSDPAIIQDLIAGRIQASFSSLIAAIPFIESGMVQPIALAAAHRSKLLPDVPTFSELGLKSMDLPSWYGFVAPAKTPDAIVQRLTQELQKAVKTADVQAAIERFGAEPTFIGSDAFKTRIADELAKWKRIANEQNIRIN